LPLCIVALVVFSVMSTWSAKYRKLARDAFRCVKKTLTLSPCDVGFEQRVKGKITAKLLNLSPNLAGAFYRHFTVLAWMFTASFFASLAYTAYSFYNFMVYGSCEPGGTCYITPIIHWCILLVEKITIYGALLVLVGVVVFLIYGRLRKSGSKEKPPSS